jgi:VWFA-related protein
MLWFLAALLSQLPDEVRVSSHDYVQQSPYTLRVDTKLVEVEATVRDAHGRAVAGLTQNDFRILDDGKARSIDHFVVETTSRQPTVEHKPENAPEAAKSSPPAAPARPPRFLALFFDDVNSADAALVGGLRQTQAAARKFVKDALKGDVRIGVYTASDTQTMEFTTDEGKLIEAIDALRAHVKMKENGLTPCPRITPYYAYRISEDHDETAIRAVAFDASQKHCGMPRQAIVVQADETWRQVQEISTDTLNSIGRLVLHLGTKPGRREILLASSGFLGASLQPLKDKIIDRALRSGVVINALDAKGIYMEAPPGMRPHDVGLTETGSQAAANQWIKFELAEMPLRLQALNEPMWTLASGTGGVFYHNNNDLGAGFRELGGEPEVTYRLGFRPEGVVPDGGFHKLKLSLLHSKNYEVQARPGYFAPDEKAPANWQARIDAEILTEDKVDQFPVGIAIQRDAGGLAVVVGFDITKLKFLKKGDRLVQRIVFTTALIDAQGKVAAAKESQMDLALTEDTYKRLAPVGVSAKIVLEVPAGVYRLRQVSEEGVEAKISCASYPVQIH